MEESGAAPPVGVARERLQRRAEHQRGQHRPHHYDAKHHHLEISSSIFCMAVPVRPFVREVISAALS